MIIVVVVIIIIIIIIIIIAARRRRGRIVRSETSLIWGLWDTKVKLHVTVTAVITMTTACQTLITLPTAGSHIIWYEIPALSRGECVNMRQREKKRQWRSWRGKTEIQKTKEETKEEKVQKNQQLQEENEKKG